MADPLDPDPLPITVPPALQLAMSLAESWDFAVSYLCGAVVIDGVLRPRTEFARRKLAATRAAMAVLAEQRIKLGEPLKEADRRPIPAVEAVKADRKRRRFRSYEGWV